MRRAIAVRLGCGCPALVLGNGRSGLDDDDPSIMAPITLAVPYEGPLGRFRRSGTVVSGQDLGVPAIAWFSPEVRDRAVRCGAVRKTADRITSHYGNSKCWPTIFVKTLARA
jgi:hypothetical protein